MRKKEKRKTNRVEYNSIDLSKMIIVFRSLSSGKKESIVEGKRAPALGRRSSSSRRMCEIAKSQRRAYRDQDPPRIVEAASSGRSAEFVSPSNTDPKRNGDSDFFAKQQQCQQLPRRAQPSSIVGPEATSRRDCAGSPSRYDTSAGAAPERRADALNDDRKHEAAAIAKVPSSSSTFPAPGKYSKQQIVANGIKKEVDGSEDSTHGREMAPVMGVPPPPPAPHMGPDGLVLPRKPYNPCLISNNHKDLRRELLFNQKIGRNVLNQKSELQRALEKQRETAMRKEAERNRDETYKDDPRTTLQRALEQRAKQIQITEESQIVEAPNPLVTARAKLRTRVDSQ